MYPAYLLMNSTTISSGIIHPSLQLRQTFELADTFWISSSSQSDELCEQEGNLAWVNCRSINIHQTHFQTQRLLHPTTSYNFISFTIHQLHTGTFKDKKAQFDGSLNSLLWTNIWWYDTNNEMAGTRQLLACAISVLMVLL